MKIFIDLGAYNGDTLEKAMKVYPDFDLYYGFEPYPANFKKLSKKFGGNDKVKLFQQAAYISNGKKKFYMHRGNDKSMDNESVGSSLMEKKSNLDKNRHIQVDIIDFAEFIRKNFKESDFIVLKIDIEGAEYQLLEHLMLTKTTDYIDKIYCEWHITKLSGMFAKDHSIIVSKLKSLGFDLTGDSRKDEFLC